MAEGAGPYQHFYEGLAQSAVEDQNLRNKCLHKYFDMPPEDDTNLSARNTTTNNGFGWKELAVIAATGLTGLGGAGFFLAPLLNGLTQQSPPAASAPADSDYEVTIIDSVTGQPIRVDWVNP